MSGESPREREDTPTGDLLSVFELRIGHQFARRQLLVDALTHSSYAAENPAPSVVHNERLEFLGDAVLELVSSDLVYRGLPKADEGDLTNLRAALVRASTLASFARRLDLGAYLRLGRGEEMSGGRDRELLIASAFEAVLGALYLDGGLRAARACVLPLLRDHMARVTSSRRIKDDKSLLQERAQAQLGVTPTYRISSETGPSHDRTFMVEVMLGEFVVARGEGRNKRQAEQSAAHAALADTGWQVSEDDAALPAPAQE